MAITDEQFNDLATQVANLEDVAKSLVTSEQVADANNMLEDAINEVNNGQGNLKTRLNLAMKTLNALSLRFSKYAENEILLNDIADRVISQDQMDALAGSDGTPSSTNLFVTNSDGRLVDARVPLAHASTHHVGGTDEIDHDQLANASGHKTHTQIDADLTSLISDVADLGNRMDALEAQLDIISQAAGGNMEVQTAEDSGNADIIYIGEAAPGSNTADAVWKITKFEEDVNGSTSSQFANGAPDYTNVFDDRESLSYF